MSFKQAVLPYNSLNDRTHLYLGLSAKHLVSCGRRTSYCIESERPESPKKRRKSTAKKPKVEDTAEDDDDDDVEFVLETPKQKPIKKEKPPTEKKPRKKKGFRLKAYSECSCIHRVSFLEIVAVRFS